MYGHTAIDLRMLWLYNVLKVLFEKLCLQERCENKKLPKTINKQQQSTSEAAVSMHRHKHADTHRHTQIRHFHPLISFSLRKNSSEVSVFVMMNPESYTNAHSIHCLAHYCILVFDKHFPSTVQTYRSVYLLQTDTPVKDFCWIFA